MNEEIAAQLGGDAEVLLERWDGRPDLVMEDVFRVRDLYTKEVTDLTLTPYQRQFVHAFWYGNESTIAVLKGRRTGYSFIACCCILLRMLVLPHSFHAITGPSKSQAKDRIDDIYDLIEWSKVIDRDDLETDNKDEIELPNGATAMAFAGNPDTSRGADSADTLFIDEQDFLENQEESLRAFSPFVALGDANTIKISTPYYSNSLFMDDVSRGSPEGSNGIISIEQPAFHNADEIDVERSLIEQGVEAVNPYLNIKEAEKDRQRDPLGFKQEYLCEPVSDAYQFFTEDGIIRAQLRGAENPDAYNAQTGAGGGKLREEPAYWHPATHARCGGTMVMGIDIATGVEGGDDTAVSVFEHVGKHRHLRFHSMVDHQDLAAVGINGSPDNPSDFAAYVDAVVHNMGVDKVFLDMTGPGMGFRNEIHKRLGKLATGFNFSDKKEVNRMMGDFNYALHNDLITLVPDKTIKGQLEAIVKEKSHDSSKPKYSGKEHAPNGKDDLAMALVLGAYPPNFNAEGSREAHQRDKAYAQEREEAPAPEGYRGAKQRGGADADPARLRVSDRQTQGVTIRGTRSGRGSPSKYNSRHDRPRSKRNSRY